MHFSSGNSFFNESPCPMWVLDQVSMQFLEVNDAAVRQYGYSRDEFLAMRLPEVRADGERAGDVKVADLIRVRTKGVFFDAGHSFHRRKDGRLRQVHVYSYLVDFNGGNAILALLIDAHKSEVAPGAAGNELSETPNSSDLPDDLLSSINGIVWAIRTDTYEILYVNKACMAVFGYPAWEMAHDKSIFIDALHPDDREKLFSSMRGIAAGDRTACEFRVFHKDRTVKYLSGAMHVRRNESAGYDVCYGIAINITPLRTAALHDQHQINTQHELLKEISWLLSHKVRSPVATILGLIPLLKYTDSTDAENKTIIDGIKTASSHLDEIIKEINEKTHTPVNK